MYPMADPLRITPGEMYALAAFCILEGDNTLSNTHEQLKVAAVLVNRMNASNWTGQFEVQTRYRLDREDFDSLDEASQALADAKSGLSKPWSRERIIAFIRAAGDTEQYTRAAGDVGDNTGFRGAGGRNTFRKESPYDDRNIGSKQPSSVVVDWPGGRAPF
jgi:hypothetical protein